MPTTTPTSDLSTSLGLDPGVERLYDNVQAQVPAIGLAMVKMAAWNTIEEFYIRSTSRREHLFWQMAAGVQTIDFNPFDENWLVAWILSYTGLPKSKIEPPSTLRDLTFPVSTQDRDGEAWVALKPVSFDAEFETLLWSQWFETILSGTLHRLYAQPAKPYSSPQLAQFHGAKYRSGLASARDIAQRQFTNGGGNWAFPYFARGRRR